MAATTSGEEAVRLRKRAPKSAVVATIGSSPSAASHRALTRHSVRWGTPLPAEFATSTGGGVVSHTHTICAVARAVSAWPLVVSELVADYAVDGAFTVYVLDDYGMDVVRIGYADSDCWRRVSYQAARQSSVARDAPAAEPLVAVPYVWRATARARISFPGLWRGAKALVGGHLYLFGALFGATHVAIFPHHIKTTYRLDLATGVCSTATPPPPHCRVAAGSGASVVVADRWIWLFGRYDYLYTHVYDTHTDTWRAVSLRVPDAGSPATAVWRVFAVGARVYLLVPSAAAGGSEGVLDCSVLDVSDHLTDATPDDDDDDDDLVRRQPVDAAETKAAAAPVWRKVAAPPFTTAAHVCVLPNGAVRAENVGTVLLNRVAATWVDYWPPLHADDVWRVVSSRGDDAAATASRQSAAANVAHGQSAAAVAAHGQDDAAALQDVSGPTGAAVAPGVAQSSGARPIPPTRGADTEFGDAVRGVNVGAYSAVHNVVCRVCPSFTSTHLYMGDQRVLIRKFSAYRPSQPLSMHVIATPVPPPAPTPWLTLLQLAPPSRSRAGYTRVR